MLLVYECFEQTIQELEAELKNATDKKEITRLKKALTRDRNSQSAAINSFSE
jgi:uncharacterized small protein (DUF1192 family)